MDIYSYYPVIYLMLPLLARMFQKSKDFVYFVDHNVTRTISAPRINECSMDRCVI